MTINTQAALLGRKIIDIILKGETLPYNLLSQYFKCEGIQFLKGHLKHYGGFELTIEILEYYFGLPGENNFIEKSVRSGITKIQAIDDNTLVDLETKSKTLENDISDMVKTYLPRGFNYQEPTVFFLYGIRGTSIVLDNKVAVDLCDDSLYDNGELSYSLLRGMLAHELHHIAVSQRFQEFSERALNEKNRLRYSTIEGLISEGMACFYFTPEIANRHKKQWNSNLIDIDAKIERLMQSLDDFSGSENEQSALQNSLFDDNLLGYTIGYIMIERIHNKAGRDRVISLLDDFCLFEAYMEVL